MKCRLCNVPISSTFAKATMLERDVLYYDCPSCGYLQTEEPTWLEEAYASPINSSDTGIMARNISNVPIVIATLSVMGKRNARVVDYAGGYGFLVRMLRDKGIDALWSDPYTDNLVARGFEYTGQEAALVTAFEAFEHFYDPCKEISNMLKIAPNILFSTNLVPSPTPQPTQWWYYGLEHGQHIGMYRMKTLQYIAQKYHLHLLTDGGSMHLLTADTYSYRVWRMALYLSSRRSRLFSRGLRSKTWSDHLMMSGKSRNDTL